MPYHHRPRRRRFLADLVEPGGTFDGFDAVGRTDGVWRRPDHLADPDADAAAGLAGLGPWGRLGPVAGAVGAVVVVAAIVGAVAVGSGDEEARTAAGPLVPRPVVVSAPVPAPSPAPAPAPAPQPAVAVAAASPSRPVVPRGEVVVLDQGRTPVAAGALVDRLGAGGWRVTGTAMWRGRVPATTVYHPVGREAEARALAQAFPEIRRVKPSFAGITQSRLVVIVVDGPVPVPVPLPR